MDRPASRRARTPRRLPRLRELRALFPDRVEPDATARRLARAHSIAGLRALARRRTPRAVFDYVDGAAEAEISLARSRRAFRELEFQPRVLRDVSRIDTTTSILGTPTALPLVFAPTGFTRMMHHEGEPAVARAAARLGIPYALSTLGTTSPEELATASPATDRWFQMYVWRDRPAVRELVDRAAAAGFSALVLTVDTPTAGTRLRDLHNGLTLPPSLTLRTLLDVAGHPRWWVNMLTTEPWQLASFAASSGSMHEIGGRLFDPALDTDDLAMLREIWSGPLVVKGIMGVEDARRVVDLGADAIVVSNHGGRQLDRAPTPLDVLPAIVEGVGDRAEVYLDGGILNGADVVAAVALGARACLVGRAYLYGLMAAGEAGVDRAGEILRSDIVRTLKLIGARSFDELDATFVRRRAAGQAGPGTS